MRAIYRLFRYAHNMLEVGLFPRSYVSFGHLLTRAKLLMSFHASVLVRYPRMALRKFVIQSSYHGSSSREAVFVRFDTVT